MRLNPAARPGAIVSSFTVPVTYEAEPLVAVSAARTLLPSETGTTFVLSLAAGFIVTLPAPEASLRYKFLVGVAPSGTGNYVITATGAIISGTVLTGEISTAGNVAATKTGINIIKDSAVVGDWVEIVSDGTKWYLSGATSLAASVTFTA